MESVLKVENICKSFVAGTPVLQDVTLEVQPGQVHALVGENGAGKSTLMNIIGGIHQADTGSIYFNGQPIVFKNPLQAMQSGISIVHQELSLAPNMSVRQNIFVGHEPVRGGGFIKWKDLHANTQLLFDRIGVEIDPTVLASKLSVSMQQLVEIAKALSFDAKVLIMDEPTSALSDNEIDRLYSIMRDLTAKGVAIIFISHKLTEVFAISDQISVLRDGRMAGTVDTKDASYAEIIQMMVGRHIEDLFPPKSSDIDDNVIFAVKGLSKSPHFKDISFELQRGEILGFAGLVGSGRTEVARAIFGADKKDSGKIFVEGKEIQARSPQEAIKHRVGYLTEDRKVLGLFLNMSVRENIVAAGLNRFLNKIGLIKHRRIKKETKYFVDFMEIRATSDEIPVINLSGGNQQKALLAKWLCAKPSVLIVDEPTRGVDVGAKAKLHSDLRNMAEEGIGIIVISSELPEILGLSDRVAVFRDGQISAILEGNTTQEEIMKYATT